MEKNSTIKMRVADAISLCHLINKYSAFHEEFMELLKIEKNQFNVVGKLKALSRNERCHVSKRIKDFYDEYRYIIDVIEQHSGIQMFAFYNYDYYNCDEVKFKSEGFYQYLLLNIDKKDKILAVLERLKELCFDDFELDETLDFSNDEYILKSVSFANFSAAYLDNLEVVPYYDSDKIIYKTNGSNYKIDLGNSSRMIHISLNSLTFNADRLPKSLDFNELYGEIIRLKSEKQQDYTAIRNSVDFNVGIKDLECLLNRFNKIVEKMNGVESKEEVLEQLKNIQQSLNQIRSLISTYDQRITEGSSYITESLLREEVMRYVKRRNDAKTGLY